MIMTATWDAIHSFSKKIARLKDPEYYGDALRYLENVFEEIHSIDHRLDGRISRALESTRSMKRLREFSSRIEEKK